MANVIQIKRAGASGSTIPSSLAQGELAYAENGNKLYIGVSGSGIETIGGDGEFATLASPALTGNPTAPTQASTDDSTKIATTAYVQDVVPSISGLAALASPAFTGTPTAATAANSTDTTQLATTAFVQNIVPSIVGLAPLASPALTGDPTAPTQASSDDSTKIATTAYVTAKTGGSGFAPVASPTFTGIPAAPTPASSVNTTQLATTAYVTTAVANLINAAPAALDTLDELAAALGDDASYAATITTALAGKLGTTATIDGGTF